MMVTVEKGSENTRFRTSLIFKDIKVQDMGIYEIRISAGGKYEILPTNVTVRGTDSRESNF